MTGLVVGLVMGNVAQAMIVTAALQMIYMGYFLLADPCRRNLRLLRRLPYR